MLALLVVLFIAELWLIVVVASHIGVLETILLMLAVTIVGIWLVKRQGLSVLARLQATIDQGRVPHRELVDGFLILVAGVLLIPPGFITDAVGLALLLPPVRMAIRGMMMRSFRRRTSLTVRVIDGMGRRVDYRDVRSRDVQSRDVPPMDATDATDASEPSGPSGPSGPSDETDRRRPPELEP